MLRSFKITHVIFFWFTKYGALWARPKASLLATPPPPCICPTELCCAGPACRWKTCGWHWRGECASVLPCAGASKAGRAAAGYRPGRGVYSPVISGLVCSTRTKTRVQHRYVSSGMLFIADRRHHALQSQDLMQSEFEMHNISPKLINPT